MNRPISIVGILQVLVIVLGFIALGIHMKFLGYPRDEYFRFSPLALFLRGYGLYFLLVPFFWMVLAVFSSRRERGFFTLPSALLQGVVIILLLLCAFLYATFRPGTPVFIWSVRTTPAQPTPAPQPPAEPGTPGNP